MSAAALSVQRGPDSTVAESTWRTMDAYAFPGVPGADALVRSSPSHPQPEFLSIASSDQPPSKHSRHLKGENTATCTPWIQKEYTSDMVGLHEEILHFYAYMSPRRCERYMRLQVLDKVKRIILDQWPQAQVWAFGSLCTGLYLPTSDIDIVVMGDWNKPPYFSVEEAFLKADIAIEDTIQVLDKTAVPIIKFIDKETEVKVDISFNQQSGLFSAQMMCQYIQEFPLLSPLAMVVKQFLAQRQLNEVYFGGINSYSLILMLVSFFQLHPRNQAIEPTQPAANLGVLLMEFFELYGRHFNYTKVGISLLNGGCYFPKEALKSGMEDCLLYIQDPMDPTENASRGCYGIMQVKSAFEQAFSGLHSAVIKREEPIPAKPSLLSRIVQISEEVDQYRKWVESEWPSSSDIVSPPPVQLATPTFFSPLGPAMLSPVLHPFGATMVSIGQSPEQSLNDQSITASTNLS